MLFQIYKKEYMEKRWGSVSLFACEGFLVGLFFLYKRFYIASAMKIASLLIKLNSLRVGKR
jgi:hypothetical protein